MTLLASQLSQLEVKSLEIVVNAPLPEQNKSLETLTRAEGKGDPLEVLMLGGSMPVASVCLPSFCSPCDCECCCCYCCTCVIACSQSCSA